MNIVWEEPPTQPTGPRKSWAKIVNELKRHPGRWAKVGENMTASTTQHLKSTYPGVESRSVMSGLGYESPRADIYARWVGESDGEAG